LLLLLRRQLLRRQLRAARRLERAGLAVACLKARLLRLLCCYERRLLFRFQLSSPLQLQRGHAR
jgi:hypothetical protein